MVFVQDIIDELDVSALTKAIVPGQGCFTTLPEVAKALNEVADVVDVIDTKSLFSGK